MTDTPKPRPDDASGANPPVDPPPRIFLDPETAADDLRQAREKIYELKMRIVELEAQVPVAGTIGEGEREELERLRVAKWEVQHTDTMNDFVALGIDRDGWKERAEAAEAKLAELTVPTGGTLEDACRIVEALPGFRLKDGGGLVGDKVAGHWLNRFRVLGALGAAPETEDESHGQP